MNTSNKQKQYALATQRNREPILEVLQKILPPTGTVLEIASGTGEHAIFFAPRLQPRKWLPSDPNPLLRDSIIAWSAENQCENLYPPIDLDVRSPIWPVEIGGLPEWLRDDLNNSPITAIVNINMIHISPWSASMGLMAGAGRILPQGGILYLYGPFTEGGKHTAPSNQAFDESLRTQDHEWGVRDLDDVTDQANKNGLTLLDSYKMPANNLSVVFQRSSI